MGWMVGGTSKSSSWWQSRASERRRPRVGRAKPIERKHEKIKDKFPITSYHSMDSPYMDVATLLLMSPLVMSALKLMRGEKHS